jgi:transcriptional regulator with XRE-family HTH domain
MLKTLPSLLERVGANQVQLAEAIGVTEETVSRWVNGHSNNPTSANLLAILDFLQKRDATISFQELTGRAA